MPVVGPGAIQESDVRPDPILQGASQYEIVKVFNPLSDDFAVQVAQSIPVDLPIQVSDPATKGQTKLSEGEITRTYGVALRNGDHTSRKHTANSSVIKAGQSKNFTGDVAQVAVRQLVNEIMQREGNTKFLSDPIKRQEVEQRVVLARGTMEELMNNSLQTVEQQINKAVEQSNEEATAFPGLNGPAEQTGTPETGTTGGSDGNRKSKATS